MSVTEILAPVGSEEALVAAVRTGADAVYLGAEQFNARRNAENFNDTGLEQAIKYCRLNGVKCYLTLNTLIKDSELHGVLELVGRVWQYGIDAVIVQDIGLAQMLHKLFPNLALHASTQLSVHSPAALPILKSMGFKRVVIAREMRRDEIQEFCLAAAKQGIEVEAFIHGALCMCLSGQCYFSAYLGGRSANRGLCAGPCRLPFMAKGGTGYDLSLKDLSLISSLNELKELGVTSFKIEGRMKRAEYVAAAVSAARQMVDNGFVNPEINALLETVFSRGGFTDGYYKAALGKNMFGVRTEQEKQLSSTALSKTHELYRRERQRFAVNMSLNVRLGEATLLCAECNGVKVTVNGPTPEKAINRVLGSESAKEALSKLGGTCYYAGKIDCKIGQDVSLPLSAINVIRKQAVDLLNEARTKISREPVNIKLNYSNKPKVLGKKGFFVRFANVQQCFGALERLKSLLGYSLPAAVLEAAFNGGNLTVLQKMALEKCVVEIPRAVTNERQITKVLKNLKAKGINTAVCSNIAAVALAKQCGFEVMGGFGLNIFNSAAINAAINLGVTSTVISTELGISEIKNLCPPNDFKLFAFCYGRQPLMLTRNCPVKNGVGCQGKNEGCHLTDRKQAKFPVICSDGFSEVLNSKVTNISNYCEALLNCNGYLYFTLENTAKVNEVIANFLNDKQSFGSEFTRGLIKGGVL